MSFMPAYLIAEHIITNQLKFDEYRAKVAPMIAKHGGRLPDEGRQPQTARGRPLEARASRDYRISGHGRPLDAWYTSPEYQPFIALRKGCTSDLDMLITLEGVTSTYGSGSRG
jgi:uncharacterized protein (DUF1330 family)